MTMRIIFSFLTFFIPIFLFYWDYRAAYYLIIFSLLTSLFLIYRYKEYDKIYQLKIVYSTLLFSFFIGFISFSYLLDVVDGKINFLYNLYLACSASSVIIFISSIFGGTFIFLKKNMNAISQPNAKEKYKIFIILYLILFILNSVILAIFH